MSTLWLVAALGLAPVPPAFAQYRQDVPDVLPEPPTPPSPELVVGNAFRSAYARAGAPRMVLFWNREFDDEVASAYEDRTRITAKSQETETELEETSESDLGSSRLRERDQAGKFTADIVSGTKRVVKERPALAERSDWRLEQAFRRELANNGVRLVDRSVAMRTMSVGKGLSGQANVQEAEAAAMVATTDLILEVLQTKDSAAPMGLSFRIDVKDLRSGSVLANLISTGRLMDRGPGRFVASASGFQRAAPPAMTLDSVGQQLALETMAALADAWQ
jgi:hypothetical protein